MKGVKKKTTAEMPLFFCCENKGYGTEILVDI